MKAILKLSLITLAISFGATLGLRYYLAPQTPTRVATAAVQQDSTPQMNKADLRRQQHELLVEIEQLENSIQRTRGQHQLAQVRGRSLIQELERHEAERDDFFSDHRQRKARIEQRLEELDQAIEAQVAERNRRQQNTPEWEARHQVDSMLAYAHRLNQSDALNEQMRAAPKTHLELVQHRFELMMQMPDYSHQDRLYEQLDAVLAELAEHHDHQPTIEALFCSRSQCELQLSMLTPEPFHDYWKETLDRINSGTELGVIENHLTTRTDGQLTGLILTRRLGQ